MLSLPLAEGAELRALEPWNATEFLAHMDRAREHVRPWISLASKAVDEAGSRQLLQSYADKHATDTGRLYGIWVDGTLMGGTLFRTFDAASGVCEIGVWLEPAGTGRGLITKAVRHMIDWAVCARGMSRVEWQCIPTNERSAAVAQRLGMTLEGVMRSNYVLDGIRHDSAVYSVLASEWLARK